jgi:SEC-C motif domain protein
LKELPKMTHCPCGSERSLDDCCGPIIAGAAPLTAEILMRSRYTAYTLGNFDYLADTLAPEVRGDFDTAEAAATFENTIWDGLEVRAVTAGGADDRTGTVEFMARFRLRGERRLHHESASFRREGERWLCDGGEMNPKGPPRQVDKVGRNEPCPCGSGKKFKKCCGA